MNPTPPHPAPPHDAPRACAAPPYAAPSLTPLGTISSSTAGPDGAKTLDGLVGDDGGFVMRDDTAS